MMVDESRQLLREFSRERSEAAFRELVRLHSPLVHGAALRMLGGDRAAAQDVTQDVFTLLVQKSAGLGDVVLSAWLYRQACRRAANHVRSESRRKKRELVAAEMMDTSLPHESASNEQLSSAVDAALIALPSADRDALVLRYFEGQDYRKLGSSLGTSEEAARKRVTRAIEKLAAALQRKGIAVGTASLGTTMAGFGATPLPASVISQVAAHAWQAAPAAGWTSLSSWLKPFLAGVITTSLVAATTLAVQKSRASSSSSAPQSAAKQEDPRSSYLRPISDAATLDDLIAEIKRAKAGPAHAITSLRLDAILERIGIADIPAFISLAHDKLTIAEQAACYEPLLERWVQVDGDAAISFIAANDVGKEVDLSKGTCMLNNLFEDWMRKDLSASRDWITRHWGDEGLKKPAFDRTIGEHLGTNIADVLFRDESAAAAIRFIDGIPPGEPQNRILKSLTGEDYSTSGSLNAGAPRLKELYDAFQKLPDKEFSHELSTSLWKTLVSQRPQVVEQIEPSLDPAGRFSLALGKLGSNSRATSEVERFPGGGYTTHAEQVDALAQEEEKTIQAGLAAGLSQREVLEKMAPVISSENPKEVTLAWLDRYRDEADFSDLFEAKIAALRTAHAWPTGDFPEMQMVDWASRLPDPEQRLSICRAAFRRLIQRSGEDARAYADRPALPADLSGEFRNILTNAP